MKRVIFVHAVDPDTPHWKRLTYPLCGAHPMVRPSDIKGPPTCPVCIQMLARLTDSDTDAEAVTP